jgi:hypothetical protein
MIAHPAAMSIFPTKIHVVICKETVAFKVTGMRIVNILEITIFFAFHNFPGNWKMKSEKIIHL